MPRSETNLEAALEKFFSDVSKTKTLVKYIAETVRKDFEEIIRNHEKRINTLETENHILKKQLDNLEQYNRRQTLRIFGITENENENVPEIVEDMLKNKMQLNISPNNIEECYRIRNKKVLNKPNGGQPNKKSGAIVVKFSTYEDRKMVYKNKSRLKSFKITIYEDLTKTKLLLVNKAIDKYGRQNVWTLDGKIKVKTESGIKIINDESDIE